MTKKVRIVIKSGTKRLSSKIVNLNKAISTAKKELKKPVYFGYPRTVSLHSFKKLKELKRRKR